MNTKQLAFAPTLTISLMLTVAACGGPELEAEVATTESNLLITTPKCNDVFDYALNPPELYYTRSLFSYQNISTGVQASSNINSIRNGLRFNATSSYDIDTVGWGSQPQSVDVRLIKHYATVSRYLTQQVASTLSVSINYSYGSTSFEVIPTSCEVVGYGAVVHYKNDAGRVATLSFFYDSLVGG